MREFVYSVLLVSQFEKFNNSIKSLLPVSSYSPVIIVSSQAEAKRLLMERRFDIVIVNAPLKDDLGLELAIDASTRHGLGVLLIVKENMYKDAYDATKEHGVLTISKPLAEVTFEQSLKLICATLEKINISKPKEKKSLEERMKEIRIVNEAKLLLIQNKHLSEDEAHRWLEKTAMNMRTTKIAVANKVIEIYHNK